MPIEDLFGVGKQTSKKLRELGINTIGDLANKQEQNLRRVFKNQAIHLIRIANGIDNSEVDGSRFIPKGISHEITLEQDETSKLELFKKLSILSEMVVARLRKEEKYAGVICVILKDKNFRRYSHQKKLKNAVNTYSEVFKYSKEILEEFYNNEPIRLIGIRLDDLKKVKGYQTSLFDEETKCDDKVEKVIEKINDKYGKNTIKRASNIDNKHF